MKEFKGTPGPWFASKTDRCVGPLSRDDDQSYAMMIPVAWVELDVDPCRQQANANLIAAAPDLLEALKAMLSKAYKQNWNDQYPDEVSKSQEAISKALGE